MHNVISRLVLALGLAASAHAVGAELIVSAASSLTDAFRSIASAYEANHPGSKVVLNFAASGVLLQQIDSGAPVDVVATADAETMDQAEAKALLLAGSRADFAHNSLVLIAPAGEQKNLVTSMADLAKSTTGRVAISNPEVVPVGRYTKAALQAKGLWPAIEPKMISTQNVRQSLDYVARGEVDAGFVYATDAHLTADKVRVLETVVTTEPIVYPIAVVGSSKQAGFAGDFVSFVRSPPAQQILKAFGFQE
ncbi:MAG: molybdate ABC transporter substrate-binding protein [Gammaproteobacteria bacterium]